MIPTAAEVKALMLNRQTNNNYRSQFTGHEMKEEKHLTAFRISGTFDSLIASVAFRERACNLSTKAFCNFRLTN